jgi:predicted dehydrogenase
MGWYHLTQLLEMKRVNVKAVVEPFFMDKTLCPDPSTAFLELTASLRDMGIEVTKSVKDLSLFTKPTMCLIAARTNENPNLFRQCVERGAKVIYLEKPGAPTVQELEDMRDLAKEKNVKVYMGYNKNVTPYVQNAIKAAKETPNAHIIFCHNNSYTIADLPEVFARNSEGMLKNMAIHELALLVTFFQVTVDTIKNIQVNTSTLFSEKVSLLKPGASLRNPEYITDFSRVAFKVTTKSGTNVSLLADRCGGNVSFAVVKDELGKEVKKFEFPDPEMTAKIEEMVALDPQMMPYFLVQSDDYFMLKDRVVNATLEGKGKDPEGVATIFVGVEALKLAEYTTDHLNKALLAK